MSSLLIIHLSPRLSYVIDHHLTKISEVKVSLIPEYLQKSGFYLTCNSHIVQDEDDVEQGRVYHCLPKLEGGKGGFGSMLRAIGAQIEKTTSREACRDLSGRRMRDVNNEKKLKDWLSKQADREREREEKRQERLARRRAGVQHNFDDPTYSDQKNKVADDLEDALRTGLQQDQKAGPSSTVTSTDVRGKRRAESRPSGKAKRQKEWLGLDIDSDDLSSDDSEEGCSGSGNIETNSSSGNSEKESTDVNSVQTFTEKNLDSECEASASSSDVVVKTGEAGTCSMDATTTAVAHKRNLNNQRETTPLEVKQSTLLSSLPPPKTITEEKTERKDEAKLEDVDLSNISSASELEPLGLERLKFALMERGLKCGGTLHQRAERLFSVKGLTRDQIDPSLFPKAANGKVKK